MKHATVRIDGMAIPLIGIPQDATQSECSGCRRRFHVQDLTVAQDGKSVLCERCREKEIVSQGLQKAG